MSEERKLILGLYFQRPEWEDNELFNRLNMFLDWRRFEPGDPKVVLLSSRLQGSEQYDRLLSLGWPTIRKNSENAYNRPGIVVAAEVGKTTPNRMTSEIATAVERALEYKKPTLVLVGEPGREILYRERFRLKGFHPNRVLVARYEEKLSPEITDALMVISRRAV